MLWINSSCEMRFEIHAMGSVACLDLGLFSAMNAMVASSCLAFGLYRLEIKSWIMAFKEKNLKKCTPHASGVVMTSCHFRKTS